MSIEDQGLKVDADDDSFRRGQRGVPWILALVLGLPMLLFGLFIFVNDAGAGLIVFGTLMLLIPVVGFALRDRRRRLGEALAGFTLNLSREARGPGFRRVHRGLKAKAHKPQRCSLCHDALGAEPAIVCPSCETRLHRECWDEFGACPTLGCARPLRVGKERVG